MENIAQVILNEENTQSIIIHQSTGINTIKEKGNLVVFLVPIAVNVKFLRIVHNDPFFMLTIRICNSEFNCSDLYLKNPELLLLTNQFLKPISLV